MNEKKTVFERSIDIVSKICTILIPVVLFYIGNQYNKAQDEQAKQQQNFDRTTSLLKSLSSDNELEKKLAIKFSKGLAQNGNFPTELLSVMDEVSASDPKNSKDAQSVLNLVSEKAIADNNTVVGERVKTVIENSPTKIYMQIPVGYDKKFANQLFSKLQSEGFNMLGIENVDVDIAPKTSVVRYFLEADSTLASNLAESVKQATKKDIDLSLVGGYDNKIRGSQLEIWLR